MALEKFTLATLAEMDGGRIKLAFEQAMKRCEDDCKDRPSVKTARKINLIVTLEPVPDGNDLESVNVQFKITDSVPKRESKTYNMSAARGGLLYNDVSPENVKQATLDMAPGPKAAREEADAPTAKEVRRAR